MGDLYPAPPGQVAVKVELLLQLQGLVAGVGLSAPAATVAKWTWRGEKKIMNSAINN